MSRRFLDTEIWNRPWFFDLTPSEKLAFFYILTQCDSVGVWICNFRITEFIIGTQLDWHKFAGKCNNNIEVLSDNKWWVVDFCIFQHKDLKPEHAETEPSNKAVKGYVKMLHEYNLWQRFVDRYNEFYEIESAPSWGHDGYQGIGIEKGVGEEKEAKEKRADTKHPTLDVPMNKATYDSLVTDYGFTLIEDYLERIVDYAVSKKGSIKFYKDYAAACRNWLKRDKVAKRPKAQSDATSDEIMRAIRRDNG